jgi:type IV secretory pathway VirB2 component (pilin)
MKFFSKQIIATFFSLSFFMISAEAWGADAAQTVSNSTTCEAGCDGVSQTCSAGVGNTVTLTYNLKPFTITCTGSSLPAIADIRIICKEAFCEVYAASTSKNTFVKSVCNAFRIVNGAAGKTFAAFAIIATGIGFFSGKVSWGLMIGVAAGIATMFGAPSIVAAISGQTANLNCDLNAN